MVNIERALDHPFQDKEWGAKMLIGAGISLVPVLNFALNGYQLDVLRNTAQGRDVPLPKWDDLGKHFIDGAKLFVVQLIYAIPILAMVFVMMLVGLGLGFGAERTASGTHNAFANSMIAVMFVMGGAAFLYGLFIAFVTPAMYILLARKGNIGAAFHAGDMIAIMQRNMGDYILVVLLPVILGVVLAVGISILTAIPLIGVCLVFPLIVLAFLATPYFYIVSGHLYGQLDRA